MRKDNTRVSYVIYTCILCEHSGITEVKMNLRIESTMLPALIVKSEELVMLWETWQ